MITIDPNTELSMLIESNTKDKTDDKAHPWRMCPSGQHYVRTHLEHIPPSKKHPHGEVITRHEHCAANPSHKDQLSHSETQYIAANYFSIGA